MSEKNVSKEQWQEAYDLASTDLRKEEDEKVSINNKGVKL
jgi:hypothetical protein